MSIKAPNLGPHSDAEYLFISEGSIIGFPSI